MLQVEMDTREWRTVTSARRQAMLELQHVIRARRGTTGIKVMHVRNVMKPASLAAERVRQNVLSVREGSILMEISVWQKAPAVRISMKTTIA